MDAPTRIGPGALREARFRAVFADVHEPVRRYTARRTSPALVDDVVSETMLVLWRRLDEAPEGSELPWCYAVARRCLANARRSQARQVRLAQRLAAEPEDATEPAEADGALRSALESLGDDDCDVLTLWAWEELAPREIAVVLGISANAASIRLHRAKRRLKNLLTTGKDRPSAGQTTGEREKRTP